MKRALLSLFIACLLLAAACSQGAAEPSPTPTVQSAATAPPTAQLSEAPAEQLQETAAPTHAPQETEAPPEETAEPEPQAQIDGFEQYRAFLDENYDKLYELCYGGIAGVGFIDLDLDDIPELLIFDAGASAAMGVQFFDIVDESGTVECVSANMLDLGKAFGSEKLSPLYVNANYFDDFRLSAAADGTQSFHVVSGNGAVDFSYSELISFGGEPVEGAGKRLTLQSLFYRYDDYDDETGEITSSKCTINGETAAVDDYEAQLSLYEAEREDSGYEAFGVFIWEEKTYTADYAGFMAMLDRAIAGYVKLP